MAACQQRPKKKKKKKKKTNKVMKAVATRKPGTAVQKEAQGSKLKKLKLCFAFSCWYSSRQPSQE